MPHVGISLEYEEFLEQNADLIDQFRHQTNVGRMPLSNEFIGDDTDSEASYMTEDEEDNDNQNPNREQNQRRSSNISEYSDFTLSDISDIEDDDLPEPEYHCYLCGNLGGEHWGPGQNQNTPICRSCLTSDVNNINDQEIRNWITSLGQGGLERLLREENMDHLENSVVLNPDEGSNLETNHQGLEYLSVEDVFELVTHGGFLARSDFNHLLDIIAFVLYRPLPGTNDHVPLTDREKSIYRTIGTIPSPVNGEDGSPLIELEIPRNNQAWSYPTINSHASPVYETHNRYLMDDYPSIVAVCALYMSNNFTKIQYS